MHEETEKFYTIFSKNTQSKNGMWEQRFYTDGRLAPCWGYQIDETASIVYGVYEHYKQTKDKNFLKQTYPMCQKAIDLLGVTLGTFLNVASVPFVTSNEKEITTKYILDNTDMMVKKSVLAFKVVKDL